MVERSAPETDLTIYSNFDHVLEDDVVKELEANPDLRAAHTAWNFCGVVRCQDGIWYEEVWHYRSPVATYEGDSPLVVINEAIANHGRA